MSRYLDFAKLYLEHWGLASVFMNPNGTPLHTWREYAENGMTYTDLFKAWAKAQSHGTDKLRLAVLTGPYIAKLERPMVVIDIDSPPVDKKEEKIDLMKAFARDGYLVVNSPRGFHVHAFLQKNDRLPYIVRVTREVDGKEEGIGEGAVLMPHTWTMPPSVRPLTDMWFTYSFVYPDGTMTSSYEKFASNPIDPVQVSLEELESDLELYLRCATRTYSPMEEGSSGLKELDTETGLKKPLFYNLEEFLASSSTIVLPRCISWVLVQYFSEIGDDNTATRILASQIDNDELLSKVPRGKRKLVSAAFTLFIAHVVDFVKYDEIMDILSHAVEDFPQDTVPLNKVMKYFLLADKDGYVYPRYAGMGSMNLVQVLGDFCTERCPYGRMCKGRSPWKYFKNEYKKKYLSRFLSED